MLDRPDRAEAADGAGSEVLFGGNQEAVPMPGGAADVRGGMTILVVEDDPTSSYALKRLLTSLGHDVVTAADGEEAWSLLRGRRVDLVLSDWMMPGLDGLELCRRVRRRPGGPYTYVVLVTARGGADDHLEALAAGADDFLSKPLDARELAARLEIAHRLIAIQMELERKNAELRSLATTDELTGLKNRRTLFEALQSDVALAARQRSPLSLVLVDVDHFKAYNDAFGHPAGDDALRGVAASIRAGTRPYDTVARYGGEEFAVLLPGTPRSVALALAERLRAAVEQRAFPYHRVTASFGVATAAPGAASATALVEQADLALYASKRRGRNRVTHHADLGGAGAVPAGDAAGARRPQGEPARPSPAGVGPTPGPGGARIGFSPGPSPTPEDVVEGLSRALVLRDGETVCHSRRVTAVVLDLARALGIGESELTHVRRGAMLHDIGKMGVPDAILHKPGPLTDEEWVVMRRHPEFARELLAPFEFLRPALDIPYAHHERWDGCGYPRGLRGEQIPLAARAFAAVDVWDALSHDRPYRKAWPADRVNAHVESLAGTHLDPAVVAALGHAIGRDRGR